MTGLVTRFAPSPTGYLHVGHAYSAWIGWRAARDAGGRFLLRIEDTDFGRCRPEYEAAIFEDLAWLGLDWDGPVWRQSARMPAYTEALDRLGAMGLLYPCFCSRQDIQNEIARMASAPHGPDGPLYPGICRRLSPDERRERLAAGTPHVLRLDVAAATTMAGPLTWDDLEAGRQPALPDTLGDAVLARKELATSYHLAVVVDDAAQGITLVTRGLDLFHATHLHRLLQALLDLPVPAYRHHRLLTDAAGKRLAKRSDAASIQALRKAGTSPEEAWNEVRVSKL